VRLVHLIYLGINGGENLIPKYLSWYKAFNSVGISYKPILVHSYPNLLKLPNPIYQIYIPIKSRKCFMIRLINKSKERILEILKKESLNYLILRIETYSKHLLPLPSLFPTILEYPFLPLIYLHKQKPFYMKLTKKYEKDFITNAKAILATLSIFKEKEPFNTKNIFVFPNSLEPSLYKSKKFKPITKEVNLLFMSSQYHINHFNGYDRFLIGLNNFFSKSRGIKFNLFFAGRLAEEGIKTIIKYYKLKNLIANPNISFIFLGFKPIWELNKIIDDIHLGINDLAVHRLGYLRNTSLKTIDFLGWNLPFILAYEDENLPKKASFFKKFYPGEEPINIEDVLEFLFSLNGENLYEEQEYAKSVTIYNRVKNFAKFLEKLK
jgi:hypothetical protein